MITIERLSKFVKLMQMTLSDNDNETLMAIRKANNILMEFDLNWEEFITEKSPHRQQQAQTRTDPFTPPFGWGDRQDAYDYYEDEEVPIKRMFEVVRPTARDSFSEFIESIYTWWKKYGRLTYRQEEALRKAYHRQMQAGART